MPTEVLSNPTTPMIGDTNRSLLIKILNATNGISGAVPDSIDVAGPPLATPPAIASIVVDSTGRQWQYFGGAWH